MLRQVEKQGQKHPYIRSKRGKSKTFGEKKIKDIIRLAYKDEISLLDTKTSVRESLKSLGIEILHI